MGGEQLHSPLCSRSIMVEVGPWGPQAAPMPPRSSDTLEEMIDPWQEGPVARAERELLMTSWTRDPVTHIVSSATGSGSVQTAGSAIEVVSPDFGPCTESQMGKKSHTYLHDHVARWCRDDPKVWQCEETVRLIKEYVGANLNEMEKESSARATCRRSFE